MWPPLPLSCVQFSGMLPRYAPFSLQLQSFSFWTCSLEDPACSCSSYFKPKETNENLSSFWLKKILLCQLFFIFNMWVSYASTGPCPDLGAAEGHKEHKLRPTYHTPKHIKKIWIQFEMLRVLGLLGEERCSQECAVAGLWLSAQLLYCS